MTTLSGLSGWMPNPNETADAIRQVLALSPETAVFTEFWADQPKLTMEPMGGNWHRVTFSFGVSRRDT